MNPPHVASERSAWLLQVISDPAVKLVPLRVAVAIAHHVNGETRDAWPSQDRLAALVGSHRGNVAHAVAALVRLGHLEVEKDGRGNRYRLAICVPGNADSGDRQRVPGNADQQATCFPGNALSDDTTRVPGNAPSASRGTRELRSGERANSEEQELNSEGAAPEGGRAPITEQSALTLHSKEQAGAPDGARPDRLEFEAEIIFGRPIRHDQLTQFRRLVSTLGREDLGQRLVNYRQGVEAGIIAPLPFAKWLRQGGLVGVANVA